MYNNNTLTYIPEYRNKIDLTLNILEKDSFEKKKMFNKFTAIFGVYNVIGIKSRLLCFDILNKNAPK